MPLRPRHLLSFVSPWLVTVILVSSGVAQEPSQQASYEEVVTSAEPAAHAFVAADDLAFEDMDVPGFDPGIKIAVIHGDPTVARGDYTLRLSFPDGYRFPPHWHPVPEHLTVVSGTLLLAMGETADEAALQRYEAGDFLYFPAEDPHFGGAEGETVIQLHGPAPFEIVLVEPVE